MSISTKSCVDKMEEMFGPPKVVYGRWNEGKIEPPNYFKAADIKALGNIL